MGRNTSRSVTRYAGQYVGRWSALAGLALLLSGCSSTLVAPGAESIVGTSSTPAPAVTGAPPLMTRLETGSNISEPGTAQTHALCSVFQTHPMLTITLLFGQARAHGPNVSAADWQKFVKATLTPAFPTGLSVLSAQGQWQNPTTGHVAQEPTRLVMILTEPAQDLAARVETVRSRYKEQFQQQSVGVMISPACVGF